MRAAGTPWDGGKGQYQSPSLVTLQQPQEMIQDPFQKNRFNPGGRQLALVF